MTGYNIRKCLYCGKQFVIVKGEGKKSHFCSDECKKKYKNLRNRVYKREYNKTHYNPYKAYKYCTKHNLKKYNNDELIDRLIKSIMRYEIIFLILESRGVNINEELKKRGVI